MAAKSEPSAAIAEIDQGQAELWAPASAATLRLLVALIAAHEPDLGDLLLDLCQRRHVAASKDELPRHPEGPFGTFVVTIPTGTIAMEAQAFSGCTSLTAITLPPTLAEIGSKAFLGCTSLAEITLPPTLAEIGACAFLGCTSLTKITLPPQHVAIGPNVFAGCPGTPHRYEPAAPPS